MVDDYLACGPSEFNPSSCVICLKRVKDESWVCPLCNIPVCQTEVSLFNALRMLKFSTPFLQNIWIESSVSNGEEISSKYLMSNYSIWSDKRFIHTYNSSPLRFLFESLRYLLIWYSPGYYKESVSQCMMSDVQKEGHAIFWLTWMVLGCLKW